jgi:repressor LexA
MKFPETASLLSSALANSGLTQSELARRIGVSRGLIAQYVTGRTRPSYDTANALSKVLQIDAIKLLSCDRDSPAPLPSNTFPFSHGSYRIPVLATVAGGQPIFTEQNVLEWIDYDKNPGDHIFASYIKGTSMAPRINDGDIVIFDTERGWEDGDVVIVTVNGDYATCKRIKRYENGIALISDNQAMTPMFYTREEVMELPVRVVGRVIESRSRF